MIIANRANYARVKSVLTHLNHSADFNLQIVAQSSAILHRFGDAHKFIEQDGFSIQFRLYTHFEGDAESTMAKSTGTALMDLSTVFDHLKPDMVIAIADRYEILAAAIAARYMNIPLIHLQGGELTGSIDESVRHAITKMANLHLTCTQKAKQRVIKMGEDPDSVFWTGCPSLDLISQADLTMSRDFIERTHPFGVGITIDYTLPFIVVLQHPDTLEAADAKSQIQETLLAVQQTGHQVVWLWPNNDVGSDAMAKEIRIFRESHPDSKIRFVKNLAPEDFLRLLNHTRCLVGNSSSGIRECSFLGTPVVNIGHRQLGRERAKNVVDCGYDKTQIYPAICDQIDQNRFAKSTLYGDGDSGSKITEIIKNWSPSFKKQMTY